MRAVRLTADGLQFDPDASMPVPANDEALVRVSMAGICSTDLELVKGYFGFTGTLGHEFVGRVESCRQKEWVGRRVVSSINFAEEGSPDYFRYGFEHHPERTVLGILGRDGAMADYVAIPIANLFEVPSEVPENHAVFAEPLAAALRIRQQVIIDPNRRFAVIGPGRLGMLAARVLALAGGDVVVVGRSPGSLELAARWGLKTSLESDAEDNAFDTVVEATANSLGLQAALRMVKPLGTVVMKSTYEGSPSLDLTRVVVDEICVVGSRCGPFAPALRLLMAGQVDVASLIDGVYPIERSLEAFEHASRSGTRKVLLTLNSCPS